SKQLPFHAAFRVTDAALQFHLAARDASSRRAVANRSFAAHAFDTAGLGRGVRQATCEAVPDCLHGGPRVSHRSLGYEAERAVTNSWRIQIDCHETAWCACVRVSANDCQVLASDGASSLGDTYD